MQQKRKEVFTTGEVARICNVVPRTVSKWVDSGVLKGYLVPGSEDRRIPRRNLIGFLREHGLPMGVLEKEESYRVLTVSGPIGLIEDLRTRKAELTSEQQVRYRLREYAMPAVDVVNCEDVFAAGMVIGSTNPPDMVIVDLTVGAAIAAQMVPQMLRRVEKSPYTIALTYGDHDPEVFYNAGYRTVIDRPFDQVKLRELVHLLAIITFTGVVSDEVGALIGRPPRRKGGRKRGSTNKPVVHESPVTP